MRTVERIPAGIQAALLVALTVVVLAARRPDQFLNPAIWVEDGSYILKGYVERGLLSIFEQVQGYHVLVAKILGLASFKASFLWAPEIALALTVAFTAAVVVAIALSPTHLPWPFACAVAALLIPTDAEVFAVSLLTVWWAGLLLVVAVLWDPERGKAWLRWIYIVLGGLSSPIVVPIGALFALRAVIERKRSEYVATGIISIVAAIQLATTYLHARRLTETSFELSSLGVAAEKFFGYFFIGGDPYGDGRMVFLAAVFAVLLIGAVLFWRHRFDRYFVLLVLAYLLICAITLVRLSPDVIHPILAGPRYFFYPFILLAWIILWVAAKSPLLLRYAFVGVCCWTVLWAGQKLSRRHEAIDWRAEVTACVASEKYFLPFHFDGQIRLVWRLTMTGEQCRMLIARSLF